MKATLRCYCCGEPLAKKFALVTYQTPTDRVFVMKREHLRLVDAGATILKVQA